jgi:hypothetical protein
MTVATEVDASPDEEERRRQACAITQPSVDFSLPFSFFFLSFFRFPLSHFRLFFLLILSG